MTDTEQLTRLEAQKIPPCQDGAYARDDMKHKEGLSWVSICT